MLFSENTKTDINVLNNFLLSFSIFHKIFLPSQECTVNHVKQRSENDRGLFSVNHFTLVSCSYTGLAGRPAGVQ